MNYGKMCEIKTGLAEVAVKSSHELNILPVLPSESEIIPTYFWVDNFDTKIERLGESGAINTTHLMAFQEPTLTAQIKSPSLSLEISGKRKFSFVAEGKLYPTNKINTNAEPPKFQEISNSFGNHYDFPLNKLYFIWLYLRKQN